MQPSTTFNWGRVVTPLRWIARIVGGGAYIIWAGFNILYILGGGPSLQSLAGWITLGVLGVGLILAIFWKGVGEIVGGLAIVGVMLSMMTQEGGLSLMALEVDALFGIPGLLFIACGWYTLAHRSHSATPTIA